MYIVEYRYLQVVSKSVQLSGQIFGSSKKEAIVFGSSKKEAIVPFSIIFDDFPPLQSMYRCIPILSTDPDPDPWVIQLQKYICWPILN